jgi:hypothetical protein
MKKIKIILAYIQCIYNISDVSRRIFSTRETIKSGMLVAGTAALPY